MTIRLKALAGLALASAIACGPSTSLPAASINNVVDTVTLGSVIGTPLTVPSGFSVPLGRVVRTDIESNFDFVFDVDTGGRPIFLTAYTLRIPSASPLQAGFLNSTVAFDSMYTAPLNNYVTNIPFPADIGRTYYIRSTMVCTSLSSALYGKLEVLDFDPVNKEVTFRVLVDSNCGYHSLIPGRPTY